MPKDIAITYRKKVARYGSTEGALISKVLILTWLQLPFCLKKYISVGKFALAITVLLLFLVPNQAFCQAPTPGTYNFEGTNAPTPAGTATATPLVYNAGAPSYLTYVNEGTASLNTRTISYATAAGSVALRFGRTGAVLPPTINTIILKSTSGAEFRLNSFNTVLVTAGSTSLTFTPYRDGNALTAHTQTVSSSTAKTLITFPQANFSNIDEVRITGTLGDGLSLDDVIISAADTPPSVPVDANAATNTIPENSANGTVVGVTASSTDPQGNTITYSLTNNAGGRFAINSTTGIVTVANGLLLDYESATSHQITVQASDGFFTSTADFTINVTNVNEAPVVTSNGGGLTASISIPENTTAVTTVQATDPESNPITFSISGGVDAAKFTMGSGGQLSFISAPDFEQPADSDGNNTYIVKVKAADNGNPSLFTEQTITVTITNTDDGFFGGYAYRKKLTLNTSAIVSGAGTLTNFPLLLEITDPDLIYTGNPCSDKVQSASGNDIAFTETDNSGTELTVQRESYDPATGKLVVWIKLPSISNAANKTINIYFGHPSPAAHPAASGTWTSDYIAVFHFDESSYSGTVTGATAAANTLTASGMSAANFTNSKIGKGFTFSGAQKLTSTTTSVYNSITSAYTLSAWVNPSSAATDQKLITNQAGTQASPGDGYKLGLYNLAPEVENRSPTLYLARAGAAGVTGTSTTLAQGNWYYVQGVYSSGTLTVYVNGVARQTLSGVANPAAGSNLLIGVGEGGNTWFYSGLMDEVRISNTAKSASWLATEYNNQNNPAATILSTGSIEFNSASSNATGVTYTWKGVTTEMSAAINWENTTAGIQNQAFTSEKANVIIPAGLSAYPTLSANVTIASLTVQSGASINLNGFNLNVFCNVTNNGTITDNGNTASQLTFNGSQAQTYTGNNSANSAKIGKLEINNSAAAAITLSGGSVDVYKLVTVTKGTLASNGFLRLKSGASTVSSVAPLLNGAAITGNVNVEIFFTGGDYSYRGTRAVTSPINESAAPSNFYSQLKNYMVITGPGSATNGFDPGNAGQPYAITLTRYNEPAKSSQSQFTPVASITEALATGYGTFLYYRGNRTGYTPATSTTSGKVNAPYTDPENTVATFVGPINSGNITLNLSYTANSGDDATNGTHLLGNPYPAVINWSSLTKNNLKDELKIAKPGGGFATYLDGISANAGGLDLRYIQPGQGFYVRGMGPGASITFTENAKAVSSTPVRLLSAPDRVGNLGGNNKPKLLRLNVGNGASSEETVIVFEAGRNAAATIEDATSMGGNAVSLSSLSSDKTKLVINYMPDLADVPELKLSVNASATGDLKLTFTDLAALVGYDAYLKDNYTNSTVEINSNTVYEFKIDKSIASSYGDDRFTLLFSKTITLPVVLLDFNVKKVNTGASLSWSTASEHNNQYFEVERSTDGKSFSSLGRVSGKGNSSTRSDYSFNDLYPVAGVNYYRLKQVDNNGAVTYSDPRALHFALSSEFNVVVYPNPAEFEIRLDIPASTHGFLLQITDTRGITQLVKRFESGEQLVQNVANFASGTYILNLTDLSTKQVVSSKFIKK